MLAARRGIDRSRRLRQTQRGRGRAAHIAQVRWVEIEAEGTIRRDIEKVVIFGCADDRLVIPIQEDCEGRRRHCDVARDRLGVVDDPLASWAAAAQIGVDRRERKNASAGNFLPECDRAGIHSADSKHSISLFDRFRCWLSPWVIEKNVLSGSAGRSARLANDLSAGLKALSGDQAADFNDARRDRRDKKM